MKETIEPLQAGDSTEKENFANRKLIRPTLPRVENHGNHNVAPMAVQERRDRPERHERNDRGDRGEQVAQHTDAEEPLVSSDVVGGRGRVATDKQSAGNVLEADDREAEEQVKESRNPPWVVA